MSIDQKDFRNALGTFATGITVITTKTNTDELVGVTVNSFASVSLEPPMILFSLKVDGQTTKAFENANSFNVCILEENQEDVSNLFAGPSEDKFSTAKWSEGENGSPVLDGTLTTLECKPTATHEGGDHTIFVGEVTKIVKGKESNPLLYYSGGYKTL